MKVTSTGVVQDHFLDRYGKRGSQKMGSIPTCSIPFEVEDLPEGTNSLAFLLDDPEAVSSFPWVHWLGCDLVEPSVVENSSVQVHDYREGTNSWGEVGYGGMCPPDRPHRYVLHVYALSRRLNLETGFQRAELEEAMHPYLLEEAILTGVYDN